ncbi:MAG: aryl-sulfate sulfotransferase, partial [Vicinamibacteraceae bacterium]
HQDWIVKVDYRDGAGSGAVLWRLGQDGDFTVVSPDSQPWFSHQHDATYIDPTTIAVYDNGNTRCANAQAPCNSRGQVYQLDEARRIATLRVNADLGVYSGRLGSAQRLSNGNFAFGSGAVAARFSDLTEIGAAGGVTFGLRTNITTYRTLRLRSLYEP